MSQLVDANEKIEKIIHLLQTVGGLLIDAQIIQAPPNRLVDGPEISINLSGDDATLFVRNNLELLKAVHQVAAATLDLDGAEHELLWFDVNHIRASHQGRMQRLADNAAEQVRATSQPYVFVPMAACERHMLHRALASSGLKFASSGEGADRCVILYPEGNSEFRQHPCSEPDRLGQ